MGRYKLKIYKKIIPNLILVYVKKLYLFGLPNEEEVQLLEELKSINKGKWVTSIFSPKRNV